MRVARQQDFLRDLREQVDPATSNGQLDTVAKAVGHAITTTFHASASELIELAKLVAFSQTKPLRQVKFQSLQRQRRDQRGLLRDLHPAARAGDARRIPRHEPRGSAAARHRHAHHSSSSHSHHRPPRARRPRASEPGADLRRERSRQSGARASPSGCSTRAYQTAQADQQTVRAYALRDEHGHLHHAYVVVWQQNGIGGYYDFEGTDWLNPPLFAHARERSAPRPHLPAGRRRRPHPRASAGARATSSTGSRTRCSRTSPTTRCWRSPNRRRAFS